MKHVLANQCLVMIMFKCWIVKKNLRPNPSSYTLIDSQYCIGALC